MIFVRMNGAHCHWQPAATTAVQRHSLRRGLRVHSCHNGPFHSLDVALRVLFLDNKKHAFLSGASVYNMVYYFAQSMAALRLPTSPPRAKSSLLLLSHSSSVNCYNNTRTAASHRSHPQMSLPSFSASQPTPSGSCSCTVPQFPPLSSSQGILPSSNPLLYDSTNVSDLNLPPNTLKILAQSQASESGRLAPLPLAILDRLTGRLTRTAKLVTGTMAKRTTSRSHSQPNMLKSGSVSAYAQGAPASSSLPQPRERVQRQPPPDKIHARRSARAAKSKAKASTPVVVQGPDNTTCQCFWGDHKQSTSQHMLKLISATQAAASRAEVTLPTVYAEPPAAALTSTAYQADHEKRMSKPALQPASWMSTMSKEISERFGLEYLPFTGSLIEDLLSKVMALCPSAPRML